MRFLAKLACWRLAGLQQRWGLLREDLSETQQTSRELAAMRMINLWKSLEDQISYSLFYIIYILCMHLINSLHSIIDFLIFLLMRCCGRLFDCRLDGEWEQGNRDWEHSRGLGFARVCCCPGNGSKRKALGTTGFVIFPFPNRFANLLGYFFWPIASWTLPAQFPSTLWKHIKLCQI